MYKISDLTLPSLKGGPKDNRREMFSRFLGLLRPWAVKAGSLLDVELICAKYRLPQTKEDFFNATEGEIDLLLALAEFFYGKVHAAYNATTTESTVVLVAQLGINPWDGDSGANVPLQVRQNMNGTAGDADQITFSGALAAAQGFDNTYTIAALNAAVIAAGYLSAGESAVEVGTHGIVYRKELFRYLAPSLYVAAIDGIPSNAGALVIMPEDSSVSPAELLSEGEATVTAVSTTDRAHVQYPGFTSVHANIIAVFDTGTDNTLQNLDILQDADYDHHGRQKERGPVAHALLVMAGLWELYGRGTVASGANYRSLQVDLRAKGLYANPMDATGYRSSTLNSDFPNGTVPSLSELVSSTRYADSPADEWMEVVARMTLDYCRLRGTPLENEINAFGESPASSNWPDATDPAQGAHWLPGIANVNSKRARDQFTLSAYIACTNYWNTNESSLFPNTAAILARFGWEATEYANDAGGASQLNQIDPAKVELMKQQAAIVAGGYTPACKFLAPHGDLFFFPGAWLGGSVGLDNPSSNAIAGEASVALQVRLLPPKGLDSALGEGKFTLTAPSGMVWSAAAWADGTPDTTATISGTGTRTLTVTFKDSTGYAAGTLKSLLSVTLATVAAGPEVGGSYEGSLIGLLIQGVWATVDTPATNISSQFTANQTKVLSRLQ